MKSRFKDYLPTLKLFMNAKKIILSALLMPAAFSFAQNDVADVFTIDNISAKKILESFDSDKNGIISIAERDGVIRVLAKVIPQIKDDKERAIVAYKCLKNWEEVPALIALHPNPPSAVIYTDLPSIKTFDDAPESINIHTFGDKKDFLIVANSKEFPPRLKLKTPVEFELPSAFKLRQNFDKNRDGELDKNETMDLLLEMRYKFDLAQSNTARSIVINRYAEAINDPEQTEYTVTWGKNSSFKIFKDEKSDKWTSDEKPLENYKFSEHPSFTFVAKLQEKDSSGLAITEFFSMLMRTPINKRADKIASELPNFLQKTYPAKNTKEWNKAMNLAGAFNLELDAPISIFEGFIELINEKHDLVMIPTFSTDIDSKSVEAYTKMSEKILESFSEEEFQEYKKFLGLIENNSQE